MREPTRDDSARATPHAAREAAAAWPAPTTRSEAMRLQRALGNRAAGRLIPRMLARQPAAAAPAAGSKLVGLKRTLQWTDYAPVGASDPRLNGFEAATKLDLDVKVGGAAHGPRSFEPVGGAFRLRDQVAVEVKFAGFQGPSVAAASTKEQELLLDHEQGHYDLWALNLRDGFIEIMALKRRTFPTAQDGAAELAATVLRMNRLALRIDKAYDGDTNHIAIQRLSFGPPRKPPVQERWEGFVTTAFTREREPHVEAPDGTTYKVPIADVLKDKGISF